MDFSAILSHPDHQEIISKLVIGGNPKEVSQWLKIKYSDKDQKHLHLSSKLLQDYIDSHIDVANQFKQDQQALTSAVTTTPVKERKLSAALQNNKAYQDRLIEYADKQIDIKKVIQNMVFIITDRVEQVFDSIQQNPASAKADYPLIKWFEVLINAVEKFDKIVNQAPDQIIQHNITVQQVDRHVFVIQDALRRTLSQIDPEAASLFMEIMNKEMSNLKEPAINQNEPLLDAQLKEVKLLSDTLSQQQQSVLEPLKDEE